jgi:hypothetical protein
MKILFRKIYLVCFLLILLLSLNKCKKFVDIAPPITQLTTSNVFTNDATATSALKGVYEQMSETPSFINGYLTICAGLSADELATGINPSFIEFYQNSITPANSIVKIQIWSYAYSFIYQSNAIIEGLNKAVGVSDVTKQQLIREAKFIRSICYFYLINLFGDVPLITATNYQINSVSSRTPVSEIYQFIINDLKDSQNLPIDYSVSNGERVRVNQWAATALLARVYLYLNDWVNAEAQSTAIINNRTLYNLSPNLDSVFLKNSREAIWQILPVTPNINTNEGSYFGTTAGIPMFGYLTNTLIKSFDSADNRKAKWVRLYTVSGQQYYLPYKYKISNASSISEYYMVLRLAEQYLIRAEARAQQNNLQGAQTDLNTIRTRAGLPNTIANNKASLLLAIEHERQIELFAELGHRWLDLKRTNRANTILGAIKGSTWQPRDTLYPIPITEIQNNSNLTQNPGY